MKTFKHAVAAGVVGGLSAVAAPAAMASVTGGVAVTSEYMFRGIVSEQGAAVQGNLDWSHESGIYAGIWGSNANVAGGNELDLIAGWSGDLSDSVNLDVGAIYFIFSEDEEQVADDVDADLDYLELYAGINIQNFSLYAYYASNFFNVEDNDAFQASDGESVYLSADYGIPLNSVATLNFHVGTQVGDGADAFYGLDEVNMASGLDDPAAPGIAGFNGKYDDGEYVDYAISLDVDLGNDWATSMAIIDTTLDDDSNFGPNDDEPKFVVTLSKSFTVAE
ncbi:MAG: hypothetical protein CMN28_09015 [Salinisphaeraceae bacterium]|nr:hypothetical protein [Salinisphaeraceae bacterium]